MDHDRNDAGEDAGHMVGDAPRKPYRRPELIEYGPVAKLTQGVGTRGADQQVGSMTMNV